VKLNDNENVEEWWPPSLILDGLANDLLDLISLQAKTIELLTEWNTRQQARIERLEQILARNGTAEAIELRSQLISEVNGRYVSEEPEPTCCSCAHDLFPAYGCDCECHRLARQREYEEESLADVYNKILWRVHDHTDTDTRSRAAHPTEASR
jgi:hypothetical protein